MRKKSTIRDKFYKKDQLMVETREKLGLSQVQFASIFGLSHGYISLVESKQRSLPSEASLLVTNMLLQFLELEKGIQADYRSLETRLFLNDIYKKQLPGMRATEKNCRLAIKELVKEKEALQQLARDKENAIIVFTTAIRTLTEKETTEKRAVKIQNMIAALQVYKQQAYEQLLQCWEPEQAKLQAKIEALSGEARALRRYRLKIIKEQALNKKGSR